MGCCAACPSEALENLTINPMRMGEARIDKAKCYAWEGSILCRSCFERFPLKGRAIVLDNGSFPVITDKCVG
jgi:ferredoxin-type protein NapG